VAGAPRVRAYRAADAPALTALAVEMAEDIDDPRPSLTPALLAEAALGPDPWCRILVAAAPDAAVGRLLGFAATCRRFEVHLGQRSLWLADLHVARDARRAGAATALMAAVGREARAQGCRRVTWDLWTRNERARAFYARIGAAVDTELQVVFASAERLERLARTG
jgi:GNAT superfamily N-acetyltransferase